MPEPLRLSVTVPPLSDATRVRTLGFLFADLRGYTRFIDENGDAAAADLVRDYRALRHAV